MVNSPLLTGFYTSQVVQDFSHQQYEANGCLMVKDWWIAISGRFPV